MVISTFVPTGKFLQDVWHVIWNELPYPILYLRKYAYFCAILIKNSIVCPKCTAKNQFGCSDSGGWEGLAQMNVHRRDKTCIQTTETPVSD